MISETEGAVWGAGVIGALTFIYKFFRIIKIDNIKDQVNAEEKEFRATLLAELKELRKSNLELLNEKGVLMAKISKLETELDWLREHIKRIEDEDPIQ